MAQSNTSAGFSRILEHLSAALAESLSSMTGQTFTVAPRGEEEEVPPESPPASPVEWQQWFSSSPEPGLWMTASRDLWVAAGSMVLAAVGIEAAADEDCRSTWIEILGQTMSGVAIRVTADVQHEVTSDRGEEGDKASGLLVAGLTVACGERSWLVKASCSAALLSLYEPKSATQVPSSPEGAFSRTFDLLLDVALPVSVSFGKTVLAIREVLKLNTGSIVELNRLISEPVEVIVNDCVIARGEVVVVEGNYGVRILQLASREDRLRTGMDTSFKAAGAER